MRWHQLTLLIGSSTLKTRVWDRNERLWEAQVHQTWTKVARSQLLQIIGQWSGDMKPSVKATSTWMPAPDHRTASTHGVSCSHLFPAWMKKHHSSVHITVSELSHQVTFCACAISTWTWRAYCMRIQRGCLFVATCPAQPNSSIQVDQLPPCCGNVSAPTLYLFRLREEAGAETSGGSAITCIFWTLIIRLISNNNIIWKKKTATWWWKV